MFPVHTVDSWVCPDGQELRQLSEVSGSGGCVCVCVHLLLSPSSYWLLWGWEQGVGIGVSGGDVDESSPRS